VITANRFQYVLFADTNYLQNFAIANWKMARNVKSPSEHDVALQHCPITLSEVQAMIAEVKGAQLLQDFRGRSGDLEALEEEPSGHSRRRD
jgi:hypothetical protein